MSARRPGAASARRPPLPAAPTRRTPRAVINKKFAKKAIEKGADGLIAVAAGAGGHAGTLSPFALVEEIREFFDGPVALSGSIATGRGVLAARATGADFAYIGSAFIATDEANASQGWARRVGDMAVAWRSQWASQGWIAA